MNPRMHSGQAERLNIGIVGAGILGLTLGYRFVKDGHQVTLYERDSSVGGLVRSITVHGISMDRFYHVILMSDKNWIDLITELGLGDRIYFKETKAGFYSHGKTYSMATIGEYLRFPLLSVVDRFRLALILQRCKIQKGWHDLERVSIQDFLIAKGGKALFESFWKPLLKAKFDDRYETIPMTYIWSRVRRMASTRRKVSQREVLGHIRGNLQVVVDTLQQKIQEHGGTVLTDTSVDCITIKNGVANGVVVSREKRSHDVVISTLPNPQYQKLLPEEIREKSAAHVEYMGIVCILLVMKKRLTPFHTLNLIDETTPYTGIIETTNVIDPTLMNGRHLVYIPKYLSPQNKRWLVRTDEDLKTECFGHLKRMFPQFSETDVEGVWIGREAFVEPLYTLEFYKNIPPVGGPAKGLFVANNSQTYPFLLNCESVVSLANSVVAMIYSRHSLT